MNSAKKILYIVSFVVLGVLLQQVLHAVAELAVINLLLKDFDKYGLGLTWDTWYVIHHVGTVVLLLAGIIVGFGQGVYWWRIIYTEKRRLQHKSFH